MPTFAHTSSNQVIGARRMNLTMLEARDRADQFTGVPRGSAKPMRFLGAFQEAEPYLGLPAHAFKLVSWLVKQTQAQDWEEGSRPVAWPSARLQAEFLSVSPARVKTINRALYEAGIFVIRDNEQGKRYGRRGPDGRIIEAFGFDLSPLALRYEEFVRLAAAAKTERDRMKDLRRRVTIARRAVRQAGEALADLGLVLDIWPQLEVDTAALVVAARKAERSDDLALIAVSIERRQIEAESALREISKPVETSPEGLENKPHTITTTLTIDPSDTVIAARGSSRSAEPSVPPSPPPVRTLTAEKEFRLSAGQLLDLAPRLAACVFSAAPGWADIVEAAEKYLRASLGVSTTLWGEACRVMGRDQAALALAIVSTKEEGHFTSGAGGYFAGMVRKAQGGELRLERTLWALKNQKWGAAAKRKGDSWKGSGNAGTYRPH